MAKADLTAARVRELFHYDPETGVFTRLKQAGNRGLAGPVMREVQSKRAYLLITVDGKQHMAHRLAILYVQGALPPFPDYHIDHINGIKDDNRYDNLRLVPPSINAENMRRPHADNKSGFLGVARNYKKWSGYIRLNGKNKNLGSFDTPEEAHQAYLAAKRLHHKGCSL